MKNNKENPFEVFKKILNGDFFVDVKEILKILVERNILSCFGSSQILYKFKLCLNNSESNKLIYNDNSSNMLEEKFDEYTENEMKEKSEYFNSYIQEDNLDRSNTKKIKFQDSINPNSEDNYIEIKSIIGKNLLILYNLDKKLVIIGSFEGQNNDNDNDNYYNLELKIIFKFDKLDTNDVRKKVEDIKKYTNLKKYILDKVFENKSYSSNKNKVIIQLYEVNINNIENNNIKNQIDIGNNLSNKKKNKSFNNIINNNNDEFEEEESEKNNEENNDSNNNRDENNRESQKIRKIKKKEPKKKPIKVKALFEIEEIVKLFSFLQIHNYQKTIITIILLLPILYILIRYWIFNNGS